MTQTQPSTRAAAAAPTSALIPGRLPLTVNTSASPAVVTLDGELIVFYMGANDDPGIYISRSNSSAQEEQRQWTNAVRLPPQVNTSACTSPSSRTTSTGRTSRSRSGRALAECMIEPALR